MSLTSALTTALGGLNATQSALSVVSSNIGNANTPGYVAETPIQVETLSGTYGAGIATEGVNRQLDQYVQSQLWTETAGGAYADQTASVLSQLQSVYGTPGSAGTLETALTNFTTALQGLSSDPGDSAAQNSAVNAAQGLAQQLNATTQGIQSLRSDADQDIATSVQQANQDLTQIATLNQKLQGLSTTDPTAATLADQRDAAISDLSKQMDIRVVRGSGNQVTVFTTTGVQLAGTSALQLTFTAHGSINANDTWSSNPAQSDLSTVGLRYPDGTTVDLVATKAINSGQIGADLKLRDQTLVQAQTQVDQLAATIASAASDVTTAGTAVTAGAQAGYSVDLTGLQAGNTVNLTYTDASSVQHQVTIVAVKDASALPLTTPAGSNPNNPVIGVNLAGGAASIATQLGAALNNSGLQFSNPSGQTLQVLNASGSTSVVNAASVTTTTSSLTSGKGQLPLFTDGTALYTGAIASGASQMTGFAGRIAVNPAVVSNPTAMSNYTTNTQPGDTTRSDFLYQQLTSGTFTYSPQTGLGSAYAPLRGTVTSYLQQFISSQASASSAATQLQQGQRVVLSTLQQKFNSTSGVNIDTEMGNLIQLQNAYAANAHVMTVLQSMMTTLLQIGA